MPANALHIFLSALQHRANPFKVAESSDRFSRAQKGPSAAVLGKKASFSPSSSCSERCLSPGVFSRRVRTHSYWFDVKAKRNTRDSRDFHNVSAVPCSSAQCKNSGSNRSELSLLERLS